MSIQLCVRERERMGSNSLPNKPHAVCVPFPVQGHINPMLKLSKLLHHKGFHVTFVNTEFNHNRLLKSRGPHALDGLSTFRFETIPDGLPPSDQINITQDIPALCGSTSKHCLAPFRNLVAKLNDAVPKVTCIVSDFVMSFTLTVAEEIGVPEVLLQPISACGFMAAGQYGNLVEKGYTPLKDASYLTNGYLDTVIDWIPGMKGIRLKDIPTFIRTTDPNDIMMKFILNELHRSHKASAIILNTFQQLEHEILESLSPMFPPIYPIGPLNLLLNQIEDPDLKSIESNLWIEETECLKWLDSQELESVLYVNFGSITVLTIDQIVEFAWGLCNSNHKFLWVLRPDLVAGESVVLPPEFLDQTRERGRLVGWCPQEQVIGHGSIGLFLTHSGWNSTLESICCGVPMICWPFFADQQTNCWSCCNQWGIGLEIESDVRREKVESLVREMMGGEKGNDMKIKALEWKKLAEEATASSDGSSYLNLEKLISQVLLSPNH